MCTDPWIFKCVTGECILKSCFAKSNCGSQKCNFCPKMKLSWNCMSQIYSLIPLYHTHLLHLACACDQVQMNPCLSERGLKKGPENVRKAMTQFKIEVMSLCKGVSKILTTYRIFLNFFSIYHQNGSKQ